MRIHWLTLVISLSGQSTTPRMRIWRALKAGGAGILRDGVYVLPHSPQHRELFEQQVKQVQELDGSAHVLEHTTDPSEADSAQFQMLFNRASEYEAWNNRVTSLNAGLSQSDEATTRREETKLRRELENLAGIDFFPSHHKPAAETALVELSKNINLLFSADEPSDSKGTIKIRNTSDFHNRVWATREKLWVDRVASAWLIKNKIDNKAEFIWLKRPKDCPNSALGFDFDGASFTHVDRLVTFEVLLKSFKLETDPALMKIAELVHYLDVGGITVPDAAGFLTLLAGIKNQSIDDDDFAANTFTLLNSLYAAYESQMSTQNDS